MADPAKLTVVIVTHEHAAFIDACLTALVPEAEALGAEVIVVDNASIDQSAAIARSHHSVQVFVNETRRGFAANSNFGMGRGSGRYVLLLNPDTEVERGSLALLVTFMDQHPAVGQGPVAGRHPGLPLE